MSRLLSILASGLLTVSLQAPGKQLNIAHYDTRDGIPQVQVLTVHQCDVGYIWLGTFSGLSRYDGRQFRHFVSRDGLNSNHITDLVTDPKGTLWIGTGNGVCRLIGSNRFDCLDLQGASEAQVHSLHASDDDLWVASDAGLFRVRNGKAQSVELPGGPEQAVLSVTSDLEGGIWIGGAGELFLKTSSGIETVPLEGAGAPVSITALTTGYDGVWVGTTEGLFLKTHGKAQRISEPAWLATLDFSDLMWDRAGRLWGSTASGLVRFVQGDFELLSERNRLASSILHQAFMDREGIVWLAHDSGLSKLLPSVFVGYTEQSGLLSSFVRTIAQDPRGRLWLGTRQGAQVIESRDGEWMIDSSFTISLDDGLLDERIYSIAFPDPETALLATSHGVARWTEDAGIVGIIREADGLPSNRTRALLVDRGGKTWISTVQGTVVYQENEIKPPSPTEQASAYAMRIREGIDGRIWFATLHDGLLMLDTNGEFQQWRGEHGLSDEMLWDVAPARDGSVWVGSNGDGLFQLRADGTIHHYTSADGLVDEFVWQVLEDRDGHIWAYTNRGLSRYDGAQWSNFRESDGLLHLEGAATAAIEANDGTLWFGSADGLMRYADRDLYRPTVQPPVVVREVMLGDRRMEPGERLPHRPGSLQFQFAGLSFKDESEVRFRYRLLDLEQDWTEAGTSRSVTYARLGGGDYQFEVMARSPLGVWSETPAKFAFSVQPAYWATWWFWAVTLSAILILGGSVVHFRERAARARELELHRMVRVRTGELREANRRLERASRTDQLTGLPNRRYLMDRIHHDIAEIRRNLKSEEPVSNSDMIFMMVDLDHFKSINDRYGHAGGDQVLQQQARLISAQLREADDLIRWGGEEFLVVARHAEASLSPVIADRVVHAARNQQISLAGHDEAIGPTCSIGIVSYPFVAEQLDSLDWEQAVQLADIAMYEAKHRGRDRWVWIRPGPNLDISDGDQLIDRARNDLDPMIKAGELRIETSD